MSDDLDIQRLLDGINASMLKYINETPQLLSLLYDMDMMPEQLERKSKDWNRMMVLAQWHRNETMLKTNEP